MKLRNLLIFTILLTSASAFAQGKFVPEDDLYYQPNEENVVVKKQKEYANLSTSSLTPVYSSVDRNVDEYNRRPGITAGAPVEEQQPAARAYGQQEEEGYYVNGFNGSQSDYEYAERIRRFHNPRFTIHISEPGYYDVQFLSPMDWNVYVDDTYAYVTPTWSNRLYFDFHYGPSYSWGWGHYHRPYHRPYYGWGGYYGWNHPGHWGPVGGCGYGYGYGNYWGGYWGGSYGYGYRPPYYHRPPHYWAGNHRPNRPYEDKSPYYGSTGRPIQRPGVSSGNVSNSRPTTRPSNNGRPGTVGRPSTVRPGGSSYTRPSTRPATRPTTRPNAGSSTRPGVRPSTGSSSGDKVATTRPATRPSVTRPSTVRPSSSRDKVTTRPSSSSRKDYSSSSSRGSSSSSRSSSYSSGSSSRSSSYGTSSRGSYSSSPRSSSSRGGRR